MSRRKAYIAYAHTHSHGKTRTDGECQADVFSRRAPKAEEEKGRSHLGGVHSPDRRNSGRIKNRSSSSARTPDEPGLV